jgi:hypothetical protein
MGTLSCVVLALGIAVVEGSRVAEQEVERRARDRALARPRLEACSLRAPAALPDLLEPILVVGERRVCTEVVALLLAGEEVVEVAAHRLVVREPALRDRVLAVVRLLAFDLCLERSPVRGSLGSPCGPERLPPCLDLRRLLDQGARVVDLLRVDAAQPAVRLEVDPGVQLDGRPILRARAMGCVEQP